MDNGIGSVKNKQHLPFLSSRKGTVKQNQGKFIDVFKFWMRRIILICSLLQCIFFPTIENLFAVVCCLTVWFLTEKWLLKISSFIKYPLSSLLLLGYSLTQFCAPILFTLLEGKELIFNLKYPELVFFHSLSAFVILLVLHRIYSNIRNNRVGVFDNTQKLLRKIGFFHIPSSREIWIMGYIGAIAIGINYLTSDHYAEIADSERNGSLKIIQALVRFAYAPFFLLTANLYKQGTSDNKVSLTQLLLYTILIIILGIGANSRGIFMLGVTSVAIAYFLGLILGKFSYKVLTKKNIAMLLLGLWLITGPLSDLGTAMVVVRNTRSDITSTELISKTLDMVGNREALNKYKKSTLGFSKWDEHYFDNIFLARFCNLKFNDLSLENATALRGIDDKMLQYSIDKFWAEFPTPVLNLLQINIDKNKVIKSSFGDYLFFRSTGSDTTLGGFKTGHFAGTGMASFGWSYLLLLALAALPIYFLVDLLCVSVNDRYKPRLRHTNVSLAGLLSLFFIFTFLPQSESVVNYFTFFSRGWPQLILSYWGVLYISRKISLLIKF